MWWHYHDAKLCTLLSSSFFGAGGGGGGGVGSVRLSSLGAVGTDGGRWPPEEVAADDDACWARFNRSSRFRANFESGKGFDSMSHRAHEL